AVRREGRPRESLSAFRRASEPAAAGVERGAGGMNSHGNVTLPAGWAQATLGDLLTVLRGVSYDKADARGAPAEGLVPLVRATNIQQTLSLDELVYVPSRYVSPEQMLQLGDIVVAASSGSRAVVGKAAPLTTAWRG